MTTEEAIRAWCLEHGRWISPDGRVHAETAALILGRSSATLRNWRSAGLGPQFYRGPRVSYRISDLVAHIEQFRCTPEH